MTTDRRPLITDDLPADYVRRMLGHRIDGDAVVFSRSDAVNQAARRTPKQHQPRGRPPRERAVLNWSLK